MWLAKPGQDSHPEIPLLPLYTQRPLGPHCLVYGFLHIENYRSVYPSFFLLVSLSSVHTAFIIFPNSPLLTPRCSQMVPHCPPPDEQGQAFPLKYFISIHADLILSQTLHSIPDRREQAGSISLCCCKSEHTGRAQSVKQCWYLCKEEKKKDTELRNHLTVKEH